MSSDDDKKKKGGFFKRAFGLKSKDEKLAEEAAIKAEQQAKVDAQMAERMAIINAAALKAAREQDEQNLSEADAKELEAKERVQAELQAKEDALAAKRLVEEKKRKEEEAKAETARIAQEEKRAAEKAEAERLAKVEAKNTAKLAAEKDAAEKVKIEAARVKAEKEALKKAGAAEKERLKSLHEKERLEREAAEKATADARAADKLEQEKRDAEKAAQEQAAADRLKAKQDEEARLESEKIARYQAEKEQKEKEGLAKAIAEKEVLDKERAEREALEPKPDGFLTRISTGLQKSTTRMSDNISAVFTRRKLDDEALEELEEILIAADFGVGPAMRTAQLLAKDKFDKQVTDMEIKIALADVISQTLTPLEKPLTLTGAKLEIMVFVGVNGSGKTTTLGKIAKRYTDQGKKVLLCAGDTFRAAAVEQLKVWGERSNAPVVSTKLGADASGLVYDAITQAREGNFDILMIDTAGRLQNRTELMDELSKIIRVIKKQDESAPHHSILVLDATVGQNALLQTEAFQKTAGVTGLIMTKLDGTAKGGVLVALADKFKLPIHFIGIGERIEDLENFSAPVFAAALSGIADAVVNEG